VQDGMDQYKAVTEILEHYHVPIVMDADLGHLPPSMPLICGSYATMKVRSGKVTVEMELR
jgi:muramoyltetrapeptide carboxypeptidase LdcA involved in peptidoglycan recycling